MLSEIEARAIAQKRMPEGSHILKVVEYQSFFVMLIVWPDEEEGNLDPFFSVSRITGDFRDFDISESGLLPEFVS
jgi:hypothetical protein